MKRTTRLRLFAIFGRLWTARIVRLNERLDGESRCPSRRYFGPFMLLMPSNVDLTGPVFIMMPLQLLKIIVKVLGPAAPIFFWDTSVRAQQSSAASESPQFPFAAQASKAEGLATMSCNFHPDGTIHDCRITRETNPAFGQSVLEFMNHHLSSTYHPLQIETKISEAQFMRAGNEAATGSTHRLCLPISLKGGPACYPFIPTTGAEIKPDMRAPEWVTAWTDTIAKPHAVPNTHAPRGHAMLVTATFAWTLSAARQMPRPQRVDAELREACFPLKLTNSNHVAATCIGLDDKMYPPEGRSIPMDAIYHRAALELDEISGHAPATPQTNPAASSH